MSLHIRPEINSKRSKKQDPLSTKTLAAFPDADQLLLHRVSDLKRRRMTTSIRLQATGTRQNPKVIH